jgi:LysM repeat protein
MASRKSLPAPVVPVFVFLLAVVLAVGCGGGSSSGATTTPTLPPATTAPTQPPIVTATGSPAADVGGPSEYVVQAGDSLGTIAAQFGVSVDAIVQANDIADPNLILPGQTLQIPAAP